MLISVTLIFLDVFGGTRDRGHERVRGLQNRRGLFRVLQREVEQNEDNPFAGNLAAIAPFIDVICERMHVSEFRTMRSIHHRIERVCEGRIEWTIARQRKHFVFGIDAHLAESLKTPLMAGVDIFLTHNLFSFPISTRSMRCVCEIS
jgi:hypothetical protein